MSAFVSFEVDLRDDYDTALLYAIAETNLQVAAIFGKPLWDEDGNCARCGASPDDPDETCPNCALVCGDHGVNEPTCDICGKGQCFTPEMEWNGETGNHVECEAKR
jgi:hypothetical protein